VPDKTFLRCVSGVLLLNAPDAIALYYLFLSFWGFVPVKGRMVRKLDGQSPHGFISPVKQDSMGTVGRVDLHRPLALDRTTEFPAVEKPRQRRRNGLPSATTSTRARG
jgi:hypothetical protein